MINEHMNKNEKHEIKVNNLTQSKSTNDEKNEIRNLKSQLDALEQQKIIIGLQFNLDNLK